MRANELTKVLEAQRDLYLRPGDSVLMVLTESYKKAPISAVLQNYPHQVVVIPDVFRSGQDYQLDEKTLSGKTVGWLISNLSISHSTPSQKMVDRKMFLISNPGITPDWLPILDPANSPICQRYADAIMTVIGGDIGGEVHIVADDGTDLHLKVPNGNWEKETGKRAGSGTNGLYGEFATSPYQGNGVYVLNPGDFLTNPLNKVIEEIRLTIRENRIVEISEGVQAGTFKKILNDVGSPQAFNLAEFAIGINPAKPATIYRSVVAEKLLKGIHIATGTNSICLKKSCPDLSRFSFGRYNAGVHIDLIKFGASVFFKSEATNQWITILREGVLMA